MVSFVRRERRDDAAHLAPVALREGVLYVRVLQLALHYELEQVSKIDILRKLKKRFGAKSSATSAFVSAEPLSRRI
jgi:hypothetical protein